MHGLPGSSTEGLFVPEGRHVARHRLDKPSRTRRRVAVVAAPLATAAVVGAGVGTGGFAVVTGSAPVSGANDEGKADLLAAAAHSVSTSARGIAVSRDLDRLAKADPKWATEDVNLYKAPHAAAKVAGEVSSGRRMLSTGQVHGNFTQVLVGGEVRWVHSDYLVAKKPTDPATMDLVFKPCAATASVEHGLVPNAVRAWEAVCNAFPEVSVYEGLANRPEHDTGHAIDAMVYGDSALGYRIAEFLRAHAAELHLFDVIYRQHIWTPVRASEGWRLMPDRGSATANHMDHVHIGVN